MRMLCVTTALAAAIIPAAAEDYSVEAEQLAKEIVEIHPRGAEIAKDADFIAARDALFAMAGDADLPHYAMALGRMFHAADDGHTAIIPVYSDAPEFTQRYPLRLKRFEDGLYVVAAKGEALPLLGKRLARVGEREVNAVLREFVQVQASGNRAWPANWTPTGMTVPGFLIGLDVAENDLAAPVRFETSRASAMLRAAADGHEGLTEVERTKGVLEGASSNFAAEIADGAALAIVVGGMQDFDDKTFEAFTAEAANAMKETQAERLIVDLRDNGGGNNMLAEPLRRTIVKSRFNRPGGIYVLTAPQTFSAAMNFATRLERETDAIFVGEPTGGSPNHFGDAKFAHAPVSNIPYIISTLRWQDSTPFDKREWILPDLAAPSRFADYSDGRDRALEAALGHKAEAVEDDWRDRVVSPWDRGSQEKAWRFFYERKP